MLLLQVIKSYKKHQNGINSEYPKWQYVSGLPNGINSGTAIAWYQNVKKPLVFIAKTSKFRGTSRCENPGDKIQESPRGRILRDHAPLPPSDSLPILILILNLKIKQNNKSNMKRPSTLKVASRHLQGDSRPRRRAPPSLRTSHPILILVLNLKNNR